MSSSFKNIAKSAQKHINSITYNVQIVTKKLEVPFTIQLEKSEEELSKTVLVCAGTGNGELILLLSYCNICFREKMHNAH